MKRAERDRREAPEGAASVRLVFARSGSVQGDCRVVAMKIADESRELRRRKVIGNADDDPVLGG